MSSAKLINGRRHAFAFVILTIVSCTFACDASAGIIGYLGGIRALADQKFETDFFLQATPDSVGKDLDLINIDMINSDVNGTALDPALVQFQASTVDHDFLEWQRGQQFNTTFGFETEISLVAFDLMTSATPYRLTANPFLVGTFTVDYSSLGLVNGDQVTLDITGVDMGFGSRSTSVAIFNPGSLFSELVDPDFSSSAGTGAQTFTLTSGPPPPPPVVPEPSSLAVTLAGLLALTRLRRRR
ncbi:MAG: PEP-CTERM sorting domain-containing protein [Planctomycetota bacterium]